MKRLLLLAAFCTLAATMVPRERRAIEEVESTTTGATVTNCAPYTPCGWIFYEHFPEKVEPTRPNDYCKCSANEVCTPDENDEVGKNVVMRCKPPSAKIES